MTNEEAEAAMYAADAYDEALMAAIEASNFDLNGWKPYSEHSGTICWERGADAKASIYATPFYERTGGIPVEITVDSGEFYSLKIHLVKTGDVARDCAAYLNAMVAQWGVIERIIEAMNSKD